MKKILLLLVASITVWSCRDDDFGGSNSSLQPIPFVVTAKYEGGQMATTAQITLTNSNTGDTYTELSNQNGEAHFQGILPGSYSITAIKKLNNSDFQTIFGYDSGQSEITFNGSMENVTANANIGSASVELKAAQLGDLVIKQIYYAGSHTTQGAVMRDQFIEIYNNSANTIYADGLYIAQTYGKVNTTVSAITLPNGQYDWTKSIGMTGGSSVNTDYVYADYVIQIPGNGIQYPILPGQSIVIAQTAVNHKSPLTDNSGDPINIVNPDLTVDLSQADFEVYLGDFRQSIGETVYKTDIQNPAVTDMLISYWGVPGNYSGNKDLIMDSLGRDSFIIFRSNNLSSYKAYTDPSVTNIVATTNFFLQIPTSVIIDGVELQHFNPSSHRPKHLGAHIDAGFTKTDASYNSQSVIRKTKATLSNGRKVLEDTNNSSLDFTKLSKANPKGFAL